MRAAQFFRSGRPKRASLESCAGDGGGGVASARVPDLNSGQNQSFLARPEWKMESDQRPSLPSLPEFTDPHVTTCDIEVQCTCLRVRHIWPRPLLTLL